MVACIQLPVIVGEWGAFPSKEFTNDLIRQMNGILEKNLWGSAYCEYHPGMDKDPNFAALCRAYPMEVSGKLKAYHASKDHFELSYEAIPGVTIIYLPFIPSEEFSEDARLELLPSGRSCYLMLSEKSTGFRHYAIHRRN